MNELKLTPRSAGERLSEYSYRMLRFNIMTFNLCPGESLNEEMIAERIGTSRMPVHEAVLNLQSEGLITVKPRKGTSVSTISISAINEGIFVRSCIEPEVIVQAQGNLSPHCTQQLLENLRAQKEQIDRVQVDNDEFFRLDDEFHELIYTGTQRSRTYAMMKRMAVQFDRLRYLILLSELNQGRNEVIYSEHQQFFNIVAFKASPDRGLKSFILNHVTCLQHHFDTLISLYPSYFSFD